MFMDTYIHLKLEVLCLHSTHVNSYGLSAIDSDVAKTIKLKVGRAVNLVKRIDQWSKQCSSKEQVIRGWYPGTVEPDEDKKSLMKGRIRAGDKVAWCHRLGE
jgi:Meiotically up-regulated gene 113